MASTRASYRIGVPNMPNLKTSTFLINRNDLNELTSAIALIAYLIIHLCIDYK